MTNKLTGEVFPVASAAGAAYQAQPLAMETGPSRAPSGRYFGQSIAELGVISAIALPFRESTASQTIARLASTINHIGGTEFPIRHYFANNLYAREILMPAGSLVISHIHREQHICTCSAGAVLVLQIQDTGPATTRLVQAPFTLVSEPGSQRVGFTLADTVWTSYHATSETDTGRLELLLYDKRDFPAYIEGDAELVIDWLQAINRIPLPPSSTRNERLRS